MAITRKTPMKRSGFIKRSPFATADRATGLRRSAIKAKVKKPTVAEGSKYLAACRNEPCFLNVLCGRSDWADPTVVPCHDNRLSSGKGMGLKARGERSLPGCFLCHRWLDQGTAPREEKFAAFDAGFERWEPVRARKMGIETNQQEFA